jgi:hypothetical protein
MLPAGSGPDALSEGGDGDDRGGDRLSSEGVGKGLVGEVEDASVLGDDRGIEGLAAHRPGEAGVTEGEDPTDGGDHVVAKTRRRGDGVEDGPVEVGPGRVAEAVGLAVGQDPAAIGEEAPDRGAAGLRRAAGLQSRSKPARQGGGEGGGGR